MERERNIDDREVILAEMEEEIEAAVIRARRRLTAIESVPEQLHEPRDESVPTLAD